MSEDSQWQQGLWHGGIWFFGGESAGSAGSAAAAAIATADGEGRRLVAARAEALGTAAMRAMEVIGSEGIQRQRG